MKLQEKEKGKSVRKKKSSLTVYNATELLGAWPHFLLVLTVTIFSVTLFFSLACNATRTDSHERAL